MTAIRVATYNVLNSSENLENRLLGCAEELSSVDADVVALQELPTTISGGEPLESLMTRATRYENILHFAYPESPEPGELPEGQAILSKTPIVKSRVNWGANQDTDNNWAVTVWINSAIGPVVMTNVHLNWKSAKSRKFALLEILNHSSLEAIEGVQILCGDFNDKEATFDFLEESDTSEITAGRWHDSVRLAYEARSKAPPATLDFETNPLLQGRSVDEVPARFDRIYVRNAGNRPDVRPTFAGLIGKDPVLKPLAQW